MLPRSSLLLFMSAAVPHVMCHGYVRQVTIAGTKYQGNKPNTQNPIDSPIRMISTCDPMYGTNNPSLPCGWDSQPASKVVDAQPGDKLTFDWLEPPEHTWPHDTGPIITYMASCGDTSCAKFDASNGKWFKIAQVGKRANSAEWYQKDLMSGKSSSVSLPDGLAPGGYLIRHEIIALHLAITPAQAEFYPSCIQVRIGGNGKLAPKAAELVTFPGAYHDADPGLVDPNNEFYSPESVSPYKFPGPAIAALATASGGGPSSSSTRASASATLVINSKSTYGSCSKSRWSRVALL